MSSVDECAVVIKEENKKISSKEDAQDIISKIKASQNLTSLKLSGNSFGTEAAAAIGEALRDVPSLKKALWSDMFVSRLKTEIPLALSALGDGLIVAGAHLVELDLSDNAFGPTGIEGVKNLLVSPVCFTLKVLKFNNNGLGIGGGRMLSKAMLECFAEAQREGSRFALEVFQSGRNRLENEGAIALAEVFQTLGSLVEVSMPQNGIYHEGISALAEAFGRNPNLKVINLSDNTLSVEGSSAIAEVLPNLQQLRVINFGDALVRPDGAKAISSSLQEQHQSLEELNLSYGEIDMEGATAVVNAIANKNQLRSLDLNGNCFGEEGIERLKEMLAASDKLEALGSLSDDEGLDSDEEEEEEEEEVADEKNIKKCDDSDKENSNTNKELLNNTPSKNDSVSEKLSPVQTVTCEDWLDKPSVDTYLALGPNQIRNYLGEQPSADELAAVFVKVAVDFSDAVSPHYQSSVEKFIETLHEDYSIDKKLLVNAILVQVGLIKSEEKQFKPVKKIKGPLLAMIHLVRQEHFRGDKDTLIHFINRPTSIMDSQLRHILLSKLYSM